MIFEKEVLSAKEQLQKIEEELFNQIKASVNAKLNSIQAVAFFLANLDAFTALSLVCYTEKFSKPIINEKNKILSVKNGFHPLIKASLFDKFTTHNLVLNEENHFALITGPNMAGKTTVMREMSLIQFLTQIGCFVPAAYAEVDLKDFIFSRLGAGDNIQQGQSTFMVEMSEMAEIVRHSTEKSLIILDEVGRGTSTYDGLSIAWALTEYFVKKNRAICLFATHYHELIEVVDKFHKQNEGAINLTVETVVEKENVRFLYKLIEGGAKQSYGIYVAKLAGIPSPILKRSEALLKLLEKNHQPQKTNLPKTNNVNIKQLSIFPDTNEEDMTPAVPEYFKTIENELKSININTLTPLEALKKLYDLQQKIHLQ
ncbi:MAG: AAA family ATPase [Bacteriovoracaceae bacterium]